MTGLPGGMPRLGRGGHRNPTQGACVMEYTALLAGQRFNDHPRCTHPALAGLARDINDQLSDPARQELISRAPALAAVGRNQAGVAVAVATAALTARDGLGTVRPAGRWRHRQLARLRARDRPGRGWWGRFRDTYCALGLVRVGLGFLEGPGGGEAHERALLGVLDRALILVGQGRPVRPCSTESTTTPPAAGVGLGVSG